MNSNQYNILYSALATGACVSQFDDLRSVKAMYARGWLQRINDYWYIITSDGYDAMLAFLFTKTNGYRLNDVLQITDAIRKYNADARLVK